MQMADPKIIENSLRPSATATGENPVQQIRFGKNGAIAQLSLDPSRYWVILTVHQSGQSIYRANTRLRIGRYCPSTGQFTPDGDCLILTGRRASETVYILDLLPAIGAVAKRVYHLADRLTQRWVREHPRSGGISNTQRKKLQHKNAVAKRKRRQRHKKIRGLSP